MDAEEFENLFAEADSLVNLPHDVLTYRTSPISQALGQEGEEPPAEAMLFDLVVDFKAVHNADLSFYDIPSRLSLPDPLLTPPISQSSDPSIGKEGEDTFPSGFSRTLPSPTRLVNIGLISKIEAIMESLADGILEDGGSLAIPLRTRASRPKVCTTPATDADVAHGIHRPKDVCFPGSTPREAWRFSTAPPHCHLRR